GAAKDGTGVGGAFSVAVIDRVTQARIGSGTALDLTGSVNATATHHGTSTTTADGSALGSTAVGAAIALAFVDDTGTATTSRNITADGSVSFAANVDGSSTAAGKASAAGADKNDESAKGNTSADDQRDKQVALADDKSDKSNTGAKSAS